MSVTDPTLFSDLGSYLREVSLDQVESNADPDWLRAALVAARKVCTDHQEFSTDRVWEQLDGIEMPHERRVMGALLRKVKALGWAVPTNRTELSNRPECHRRPVRVWRSLLV